LSSNTAFFMARSNPAAPLAQIQSSPAGYWSRWLMLLTLLTWAAGFFVGFITALKVLAILGFAATVAGVRLRYLGLLGLGMLCTLDSVARPFLMTGGLWRWNTLNYWLVVMLIVYFPILLCQRDPHSWLWLALVVLSGLQLLMSPDTQSGIQHVLNMICLFGILVYFVRAGQDAQIWYRLGLLNGTVAAAGGLLFYIQRGSLPDINPNAWAYMGLTGIFSLCLGYRSVMGRSLPHTHLILLAAVNFIWVFLSGSRGGVLTASVCLLYMTMITPGLSRRAIILASAALLAFGLSSQFRAEQDSSVERLEALVDPNRSMARRTSGRSDLALGGWHMFLEHPLGVGTGGYRAEYARLGRIEGHEGFGRQRQRDAHSAWVKILAENGLLGILLFAGYVVSFAVVSCHKRRECFLGLLTTIALGVAFISSEFQGKGLWLLAAGTTVRLCLQESQARRCVWGPTVNRNQCISR
jgi:O-antigen ligase